MKSYYSKSDDGYDSVDELFANSEVEDIDDLVKDSEDESIREPPPTPKNLKDLSEKSGIITSYTVPTSLEIEQIFAKPIIRSDEKKHKNGKDKKYQLHKRMENKRDFEKRFKGRSEKSQRQEEKERSWKKFISREMTRAGKEENKREHERVVKGRH